MSNLIYWAFGDVGVSLFVAGAAFGDVGMSLFVAGAVFGDVGASLFVAGAVFGEIWVERNVVIFNTKCVSEARKVTSANGRVQEDEFMVGGRALELTLQLFSANFSLILECNFAWQAQYLVRLEGDAWCSAHCK